MKSDRTGIGITGPSFRKNYVGEVRQEIEKALDRQMVNSFGPTCAAIPSKVEIDRVELLKSLWTQVLIRVTCRTE